MLNFKDFCLQLSESLDLKNPVEKEFYKANLKNWDPSRYKELFQDYSSGEYKLDKSKTRIYFPLKTKSKELDNLKAEIISALQGHGYNVIDYIEGEVVNPKKKIIKIDVAFNTLGLKELKDAYHKDLLEHKKADNYLVVISRLPYDIIGMSMHRRWSAVSCMNLLNHGGRYAEQYLPMDIKQGSLVAYLIRSEDKLIKDPLARLTIRPYIGVKDSDIIFDNSTKVYLDDNDNESFKNKDLFVSRVEDWIRSVHNKQDLNGLFQIKPGTYKIESKPIKALFKKEFLEKASEYMEDVESFLEDEEEGLVPNDMILFLLDSKKIGIEDLSRVSLSEDEIQKWLIDHNQLEIKYFDRDDIQLSPKMFAYFLNNEHDKIRPFVKRISENRYSEKEIWEIVKRLDDEGISYFIQRLFQSELYEEYSELIVKALHLIKDVHELRSRVAYMLRAIDTDQKLPDMIMDYILDNFSDLINREDILKLNEDQKIKLIDSIIKSNKKYNQLEFIFRTSRENLRIQKHILDNEDVAEIFVQDDTLNDKWKQYVADKHPKLKEKYDVYFKGF